MENRNISYAYIFVFARNRYERIEIEKKLSTEQILIRYPDNTFGIARGIDIVSVEKYQELREKELIQNKKQLKDFMSTYYLTIEDIYTILEKIDNES